MAAASVSDLNNMTQRIEAAMMHQAAAVAALHERIDQGDVNIEQRFSESEKRMADALA